MTAGFRSYGISGSLPCLALAAMLAACGHKAAPADAPAVPKHSVMVAEVVDGPGLPPVTAAGIAVNRDEAKLAFKLGGVIRDIALREGDSFHKGQALASLETNEIDASVRQAEEAHDKAQRDLERGRTLFAKEVITREQLDDLSTAEAIARASLASAHYNQGYAHIVAPSDGVVLRRLSEIRELVSPGQPVLVVSSSRQGIVLRAGVSDRDVVKLHKDDSAQLFFDALPGHAFAGKVVEIGQAADPQTGTYRVEIEAQDASAGIISGMIGKAIVTPADNGGATRSYIPVEALVEGDQQRAQIYLLGGDGHVHASTVGVAFIAGDNVALADKLPAGSRVVTTGAAYLHEGEAVEVRQ